MKRKNTSYEIIIIGGGMVGAVLALVLAREKFRVLVIDQTMPAQITDYTLPDLRVSAINCHSTAFLRRIGAWQRIDHRHCTPYRRLETWEWPLSKVIFEAKSINQSELGFMVENRELQQALWQGFLDYDTLTLRCPVSPITMTYHDYYWHITLNDGSTLTSKMIVGADGTNSWVRQQVGITTSSWKYNQSCLLLSVEINGGQQQDVTWQEFHPSGPRAFLPLYKQWASLVWYDHSTRIRQLKQLNRLALTKEIYKAFPTRLGNFTLHNTASFTLIHQHAYNYVLPGLALIGDAAHTIHPLAGQGVNLGFRDAETLAEVLITARNSSECWEKLIVLQRYQHRRRSNNLLVQVGINTIYAIFKSNTLPILLARNIGLILAQRSGLLKRQLLRYMVKL